MNTTKMKYCSSVVLLIMMVGWSAGCFRVSLTEQERLRKQLTKRFDQFMKYKMQKDVAGLYDLHSPDYRRRVTKFDFPKTIFPREDGFSLKTVSYTIEEIEFSSHFTEAIITYKETVEFLSIMVPMTKPMLITTSPKLRWVLVNDVWYRETKRVLTDVSGNRIWMEHY